MNEKCEFCHKDKDGYVRMFGAFCIHENIMENKWEIATGHCKPRQIYFCPMCGRELPKR